MHVFTDLFCEKCEDTQRVRIDEFEYDVETRSLKCSYTCTVKGCDHQTRVEYIPKTK